MKQVFAITRKELSGYFGSPMALIFIGVFLALALFSLFWVDAFFARGIADVRPLFRSLPILLIFLVAALTMRQWSDEEETGALEVLLTLPVNPWQLVLGKFLAVMIMVGVALGLTLFIPLTVSFLGNLDWGPVIGGYLAALLLAAAYAAIGLFISSRTDNSLVALILSILVCGLAYLVGASAVVDAAPPALGGVLRGLGAGSRFESILRGVIDLRDLVYYLSLTAFFLLLNTVSLDSKRWGEGENTARDRRRTAAIILLVGLNLLALNLWLYPLSGLRADLTEGREYSLSQPTKDLLGTLGEPLLVRAYISEKTHPLLAPLVPTVTDMLREYEIAGRGRVQAGVVDPTKDPDLEEEANQTYGIRPTPFRVAGRYEDTIINSYFDILIRYGDQSEVINFQDLIEVEPRLSGGMDVRLRNLEYDLTRSLKKVVQGFQSTDAVLAGLAEPARLTLFTTPATLPAELQAAPATIQKVANELAQKSNGKLVFEQVDPTAAGSAITPPALYESYGIQPYAASLFSSDTYFLHLLLQAGDKTQLIYPGADASEAEVRTAIDSGLKRSAPGFLKVVGFWAPPETPTQDPFGQQQQPFTTFRSIRQQLAQEYEVRDVDLSPGQVPADIDTLVLAAPQNLDDVQRFAIDQFLMRGGSVIAAAGRYGLQPDQFTGQLGLAPLQNGLDPLLASYGITVENTLVMDPQNEPFPVPVTRNVGGVQIQEIQAVSYPPFVDVRPDAMAKDSPITANLPAVTLAWSSPVNAAGAEQSGREATTLLSSGPQSWATANAQAQPNLDAFPQLGFPVDGPTGAQPLAVAVQGPFASAFAGKTLAAPTPDPNQTETAPPDLNALQSARLDRSPDTARLVVIGSSEFLNDTVFDISSSLNPEGPIHSLQLLQNAVDWSVQDLDLLGIRARGTQARVLEPLSASDERFWEVLNYAVALIILIVIGVVWAMRRRNEKPMTLVPETAAAKEA